jgi:hypothetical protein
LELHVEIVVEVRGGSFRPEFPTMRTLVLLLLLSAGTALAAAGEKPAALSTSPSTSESSPAIDPAMAAPANAEASPVRSRPATALPVSPDEETRRRLMVLLMMRNAAEGFPAALLRTED